MANADRNALTKNLSGRVGNIVYRQRNGKTIACRAPVSKNGWKPTLRQAINRAKFKTAHEYGLKAKADPKLFDYYNSLLKKGEYVYHVAVRDASKPPRILDFNIEQKKEEMLTVIHVSAVDDTKVVEVAVSLFDKNGQVINSGPATQMDFPDDWEFYIRHPQQEALYRVEIIAKDMAGNTDTLSTIYEHP